MHPPKAKARVEGILVAKDFTYRLMAPSNLSEFTDLVPASLSQRLVIPCRAPISLVRWHLESMFGIVKDGDDEDTFTVRLDHKE
jgi:cleavage and polyadenylation specificity factor subunit 3